MSGFVLVKDGQWILLDDWSWVTPADQLAYHWRPVAVFRSRRQADRVRRHYGCEAWRAMTILRIRA